MFLKFHSVIAELEGMIYKLREYKCIFHKRFRSLNNQRNTTATKTSRCGLLRRWFMGFLMLGWKILFFVAPKGELDQKKRVEVGAK